jgi:predicted TIM-barrel fold metal-dependent hydrolase
MRAPNLVPQSTVGWIDTHVHVFRSDASFAVDRRYAPDYDATPEALLSKMRANGIDHALLVQPSFLGTDNSFLLRAIADDPARFSGIAVVDPMMPEADLLALQQAGIVGVRLNCIGKAAPDFAREHGILARRLGACGLVLQIQAEGAQWRDMETFLSDPTATIVIDHFGRSLPSAEDGGLASLLRSAKRSDRLWIKFSAPYRLAKDAASSCATAILDAVGPGRIVWGSDWPATQFEGRHDYGDTLRWLEDWVPDADHRQSILSGNPSRLFRLASHAASTDPGSVG